MALALLGHALSVGGGGATATPARNTTGAKLIVLTVTYNAAIGAAPTDSAGNTWTLGPPGIQSGSGNLIALYYCLNPITSATHTFTVSQGVSSIAVSYWSGAAPQKDKQNSNATGSGGTMATGSITPASPGELLIAACSGGGGAGTGATAIDNGFTILQTAANNGNAFGLAHAYLFQAAAAPINPAWTGTGGLAAAILSFIDAVQLNATPAFTVGATATLTGATTLTGAATIRVSAAGALAQGLFAASGLSLGSVGAILGVGAIHLPFGPSAITFGATALLGEPGAALTAAATIRLATAATLANRTTLEAGAGLTVRVRAGLAATHPGRVTITLDGVDVRARVHSVTIRDILNDAPNTAAITFAPSSAPPLVNQRLRIVVENDDTNGLLFAGTLQAVTTSYEGRPSQLVYPCHAIDDTATFNRTRPFGAWVNTSATTIALALCAQCAPMFDTSHVDAGLPAATITFDGSETLISALARLAAMIGAYTKVEDLAVYFFQTLEEDPPDPIADAHCFLHDPPIAIAEDVSQQRTRVYGRGHGEPLLGDYTPGDPTLPLADVVMFNPGGGRAVASTTPDGAVSERLTYTGVDLGGAGTFVGPGAAPSAAPNLAIGAGAGVGSGHYEYAITFQTAAGESLIGPRKAIDVSGVIDPPATYVSIGAHVGGLGPDPGAYTWAFTRVTADGETTPSPLAGTTITDRTAPTIAPAAVDFDDGAGHTSVYGPTPGDVLVFRYSYGDTATPSAPSSETALSPPSAPYTVKAHPFGGYKNIRIQIYYSADLRNQYLHVWAERNGATAQWVPWFDLPNGGNPGAIVYSYCTNGFQPLRYMDLGANPSMGGLTLSVDVGPVGTIARKLYRTAAGGSQLKLLTTLADNTTREFIDRVKDAGLGANAPTVNTTLGSQVAVSAIPQGAGSVTARKLYRTPANGAGLQLLTTIADNVTTTYLDTVLDAALGAAPPATDASGLTQPAGRVLAGATSMLVAGPGAFRPTGGWILGPGGQLIRYAAIVGNTLTGIPATGSGAITATINYNATVIAAPALIGVAGLTHPILTGARVCLLVQRDDLDAQALYGVIEYQIVDERRAEASLQQLCDADLQRFARPLLTVGYATRDPKTKSGKSVAFDLASPPIDATLTIQDVTITEINVAPALLPRYTVSASSVRFSLEDILRQLAAAAEAH